MKRTQGGAGRCARYLFILLPLILAGCPRPAGPQQVANTQAPPKSETPVTTEAPQGEDPGTPTTKAKRKPKKGETEADVLVNETIDDLEDYWQDKMRDVYDKTYKPIKTRHAYDQKTPALGCGGSPPPYERAKMNASYCPVNDSISWDRGTLIPYLTKNFGEFSVSVAIAHEWGHAIQFRGGVDENAKTILLEQQADCFAGAWSKNAQSGKGKKIRLQSGDLEHGLSALVFIRDEVGQDPDAQNAHGSAFDRINAFQEGFEQGPQRCREYGEGNEPAIVEMPFQTREDQARGGNYPYDEFTDDTGKHPGAADFVSADLAGYYKVKAEAAGLSLPDEAPLLMPYTVGSQPSCDGNEMDDEEARDNIYYCEAENFIAYDDDLMRAVYDSIGDLGVGTLVAEQYAVDAQLNSKIDPKSDKAVLQQSCMTGAWAFSVANGEADGKNGRQAITLSPGDLDEVVQAFLAFGQDPNKQNINAFARTSSFRTGYQSGEEACKLQK